MVIDQTLTGTFKLHISWPIISAGALIGAVMAWGVLAGDEHGRVNLLYLLFVYLFIPLLSLVVSSTSLIFGRGINLARLIVALPIWSNQKRMLQRKTRQLKVDKFWFFFQSHLAALAFSLSSLLVFFILLLATDINFVWRSTLLDAADLLPLLEKISTPWMFWLKAQPTLELLQATQDSRLDKMLIGNSSHADWWRFVLAVQVFYCLILRTVLLIVSSVLFKLKLAGDIARNHSADIHYGIDVKQSSNEYAPLAHQIPRHIAVNNWMNIDLGLLHGFSELDWSPANQLNAGPLASLSEQRIAERWQGEQVILVKAWEPPLGELEDFMQNGRGYIWPIDWQNEKLVQLKSPHLEEWRRFVSRLTGWQVFVPVDLLSEDAK